LVETNLGANNRHSIRFFNISLGLTLLCYLVAMRNIIFELNLFSCNVAYCLQLQFHKMTKKSLFVYVVLSYKAFFGYIFFNFSCRLFQGFFRRMAKEREAEKYQCNKAGDCEINMITRNLCKACRYRACLRAGMCVEGTKPLVLCYFLGIKNVESY